MVEHSVVTLGDLRATSGPTPLVPRPAKIFVTSYYKLIYFIFSKGFYKIVIIFLSAALCRLYVPHIPLTLKPYRNISVFQVKTVRCLLLQEQTGNNT
jgi:hypothetical protein